MSDVKLIGALVLAVILSVGVSLFGGHYFKLEQAAAQNEQRGGVATATAAGVERGSEIDYVQEAYVRGLASGRQTFQTATAEAKRNEPETAIRAVRPVPDSLRNAYRERRLARERLGCAGAECQEGHTGSNPAER